MEKRTREKVKPHLMSAEDRKQLVLNFIAARLSGSLKTDSHFDGYLASYLQSARLAPVSQMTMTGGYVDSSGARAYFQHLLAIVTGSDASPPGVVQKAIDQLSAIILALRDHIEISKQNYDLLNWEQRLVLIEKRLGTLEENLRQLRQKTRR